MKLKMFAPVVALAALSLAMPAAGQDRQGQERRGGERAQPRQQGQRAQPQGQRAQPRQQATQPRQEAPRAAQRAGDRAPNRNAEVRPRAESARGIDNRRSMDERGYRGRVERPHVAPYRPYYYARPYYNFRPRFNVGFGLWLGYAVPYPYYGYPYPYTDNGSYDYPPPPPDAIDVAPGQAYGGLSFDIQPSNAAIYVDGQYAGIVGDFTPNNQPLTLLPGEHQIQVQAEGYRPMTFEVNVPAGQVLPYRGDLQPLY